MKMSKFKQDKNSKKQNQRKKTFKKDTSYTQNREISWLRFNERVLEEASDPNVPLYERLKFIAIFTSNLDEFFMVRVGSLTDLVLLKKSPIDNKTGKTPSEQLDDIFDAVPKLYEKRYKIFSNLERDLRLYDIYNLKYDELSKKEKDFVVNYYENFIKPVLSPQVVDLHHPFPHLINNKLYLVIKLKNEKKETLYGFLSLPSMVPKILTLPCTSSLRYMIVEDVILKFADQAFSMYEVIDKSIIRVTRNADINPDDEQYDIDDDYRHHMKKVLKKRSRLRPVRLEIYRNISLQILDYLCDKLNLKKSQVFKSKSPLDMKYVFSLGDKMPKLTRRSLSYEQFIPKTSPAIKPHESMIKQIMKRDILLFYPYEKMNSFLMLIKEAAIDPCVVSIKITIYRLATNSMLVDYLKLAVENKKEVIVLMELRARFDEESNIKWSDELEQAGCKILYGFEGYKVHSKICLITRREKGKIQYITQIGTGNYNESTAKVYTDLCLMTTDNLIGKDAYTFFQNMAISNLSGEYGKLLVAPHGLKNKIINFIDDETVKCENGKIIMKMNSLTDREIIDKLAEASQAGVEIKLIIRGICCLLPGINDKTENIKIISIVGRFLEHSRIYCFGRCLDNIKIYIGSADMMTRNTQKRVEILAPVLDENIKKQILNILDVTERDTIKARRIKPNGELEKIPIGGAVAIDSQAYFMNLSNSYDINENGKIKRLIKFLKDKFKLKY